MEVLSVFSSKEIASFRLFLESPFLLQSRSNEVILNLLEWICIYTPPFDHVDLARDTTFGVVFPGKPFQKGKLEKAMSLLLKETYRFISYQDILEKEKEIPFQIRQTRFFRDRKMEKFYQRSIQRLKKNQQKVTSQDQESYFKQYLIEKELSDFAALYNSRGGKLNIPNTLESLDIFYLAAKLEYSTWLLAQNQNLAIQNQQKSLALLELMLDNLDQEYLLKNPLIQAYAYAFQLLLGKREKMFERLKQFLEEKEKEIPLEKLKALQALCRNYYIVKYNAGEGDLEEVFRLYQLHLQKGYLYYKGGLLSSTIRNLVVRGLKLKEHNWVYDFLQNAKGKIIGTKYPNEVYSFNMAWYYFSLHQYDQALDLLTYTYEDVYYKVAAKRLEIMILFDQNSLLMESRLDAFKIYIFRVSQKSLSDLQRKGNNNFADLLKQIMNPKTQNNLTRIAKITEKIKTKKVLTEKDWLLEKLEEL